MKKKLEKFIFKLFLLILVLITNKTFFQIEMASASESQNSNLIEKISTDYTNKFCNSIGFGLSKESAMNFSISENKKIFKNRKGIKSIDKELLAHKIAFSVIDSCGYQLNLYGDKDIEEFARYYLSIDQESEWVTRKNVKKKNALNGRVVNAFVKKRNSINAYIKVRFSLFKDN